MEPVAVGLIGAGPWAERVHAPVLSAGPHTRLAGVWARRPEAAARLGAPVYERLDELFEVCEAVAFSVPPAVQAELGLLAAKAGKALLLEKPLAADLDGARALADAVAEAGVGSQMVLSYRYTTPTRAFLDGVRGIEPFGGHAFNVSGALNRGPYLSPWRLERGAILDVGPHMIDLLDAALGPVTGVRAHGDTLGWVGLLLEHQGGAVSEASLCMAAQQERGSSGVSVHGRAGSRTLTDPGIGPASFAVMAAEFAETVRTGRHPLDARHGLHLQRIVAEAEAQLAQAV
jgi:predicted dehydrogenase